VAGERLGHHRIQVGGRVGDAPGSPLQETDLEVEDALDGGRGGGAGAEDLPARRAGEDRPVQAGTVEVAPGGPAASGGLGGQGSQAPRLRLGPASKPSWNQRNQARSSKWGSSPTRGSKRRSTA